MGRLKNYTHTDLRDEQAVSIQYTNRHAWGDFSVLNKLTPERLSAVLNDVKRGECPAEYLELANDIELKDLHYRSVLSTRKDAVTGLEIKIIPAGDDKRNAELAECVERDIIKNPAAIVPLRCAQTPLPAGNTARNHRIFA
jgi:phage gp29-like protein